MKPYSLHKLVPWQTREQGVNWRLKGTQEEWWTKVGFRCKRELYCTVFQPLCSSSGTFQRNCGVDAAPASPLIYREAADRKCQLGGFISPSIPVNVSLPSSFFLVPQVALHIWGKLIFMCNLTAYTPLNNKRTINLIKSPSDWKLLWEQQASMKAINSPVCSWQCQLIFMKSPSHNMAPNTAVAWVSGFRLPLVTKWKMYHKMMSQAADSSWNAHSSRGCLLADLVSHLNFKLIISFSILLHNARWYQGCAGDGGNSRK